MIEKISGKLASRPKPGQLLAKLERGDAVVITRLRRIGRNHAHLLALVEHLDASGIDFIVLEQGIDTTTPIGRLFFRFLATLAEFDREALVEGTLEGLESARARGRTGGPPKLTQVQLDQAQRMYDDGHSTPQMRLPSRSTSPALPSTSTWPRRRVRPGRLPQHPLRQDRPVTSRRYRETGQSEPVQLEADRKWWNIAPARERRLRGMVFVAGGTVTRIRAVQPDSQWQRDDQLAVVAGTAGPLSITPSG